MNNKLYKPPFKITNKILNYVSEISELITKIELMKPKLITPVTRKSYMVKTIKGTLEIEGINVEEEKVTLILNGKRVIGSPKEIAEIKGAISLYKNLKTFDYTSLEDILRAHKILTGDILKDAGRFRDKNVGVGNSKKLVHVAPPAKKVSQLMQDLFNWLKYSDTHLLIKSSAFHFELEFIHPFIDGNGRIGRFWQTLILYNWKPVFANIPIESMVKEYQDDYYNALEKSGEQGNSTYFIEFVLRVIAESCKWVIKKNAPNKVPQNDPNKRLEKIIKLINKDKQITALKLSEKLNVSSKTIKRDIAKLKEKGILKRIGSSKSGYWEINKKTERN